MRTALRVLLYVLVFILADRLIDLALDAIGVGLGYGILLRVLPALAITVAVARAVPPVPGRPRSDNAPAGSPPPRTQDDSQVVGVAPAQSTQGRRLVWWAVAIACVALAAVGVTLVGLRSSQTGRTAMTGVSQPAVSPSPAPLSAKAQAELYFAQLEPTVNRDYAALLRGNRVSRRFRWDDQSTWPAMAKGLRRDIKSYEELLVGYSLIEPPSAFRTTHRLLLRLTRLIRDGELYLEEKLSGGWSAAEFSPEWNKMRAKLVRVASDYRIALRVASKKSGVEPPTKMFKIHTPY